MKSIQDPPESIQYNIQYLAKYDLKIFTELRNRNCVDVIEDIDRKEFDDFTLLINQYIDKNAPNQTDLKEYIGLYLHT